MDFLVESEKFGLEMLQEIIQNGNRLSPTGKSPSSRQSPEVLHSFYNCLIGFRPFDLRCLLK